jgi:hypothetical protein
MRTFVNVLAIVYQRGWREQACRVRNRVNSQFVNICLRRDTHAATPNPAARVSFTLRPATHDDLQRLLASSHVAMSANDVSERLALFKAGLETAFVGETAEGALCCLQWLIDSSANTRLAELCPNMPSLANDEALAEYAYVPKEFQGRNVLPAVLSLLAASARTRGIRWLLSYPSIHNLPVLHAMRLAGFQPFGLRKDRWRWLRRYVTMEPLPAQPDPKISKALRLLGVKAAV